MEGARNGQGTHLLTLAQSRGEDLQRILGKYAIERFLHRLGQSQYRNNLVLKGATLFTLWTGDRTVLPETWTCSGEDS